MVVRQAVAGVELQQIDEVVLNDRNLDFAVKLANVRMACNWRSGAPLAGEVTGLELDVRAEGQGVLHIVDTDIRADAIVSPRSLEAVISTGEGDIGFRSLLSDAAALEARHRHVGQSSGVTPPVWKTL